MTVPYTAHREALTRLRQSAVPTDSVVLLQGPALAGKSTIILKYLDTLDEESAVATIDGNGLDTLKLLEAVLGQFGYELDYNSANELFGMLRVFALQQAARHAPPIIVIENAHGLKTNALNVLGELADLEIRQRTAIRSNAIKLILVSDHSLRTIADEEVLAPLLARTSVDIHLRPMTPGESTYFLHQKLRKAGSAYPEYVFPFAVCEALHEASGGWPGVLERLALLALASANALPVTVDRIEHPIVPSGTWDQTVPERRALAPGAPPEPPRLVVSKNGNTVTTLIFDKPRLLVGRSEHNDVAIPSRFVSRHHLLLVRHGSATILMDLNSTNGTLVNSRRVSNHVLANEDVISLGQHRIKFYDPHATARGTLEGPEFTDTAIMKTLEDMRKLLAQENTEVLPAASSDGS